MATTLSSEVWLIKSRTNPFPVKGEMVLAYPAGGAITNVMSMSKGRKLAKEWKSALGV